ncbi:MAG: YciI family protein [Thermoleophilia bacterium]|nr:YciI family protein [Thermoleophilia bacterium]
MTGKHQILFYDYVEDIVERRGPHREAHLARAAEWRDRGELVSAGALGDPPHGAAFVFSTEDVAAIEGFASDDPYVQAGLVTSWRVVPWNVVISAD